MMKAFRKHSCVTLQMLFSVSMVQPVSWMDLSGCPSPHLVKVRGRFCISEAKFPTAFLLLTLIQAAL